MFEVNTPEGLVKFTFNHIIKCRKTYCLITKDDIAIGGFAHCSIKDNFNKAMGRKVSLTKALTKSGLSKESRKAVWHAYFYRGGYGHRQL